MGTSRWILQLGMRLLYLLGDLSEVIFPSATTPAPDIDVWITPRQFAHQPAQFLRIAFLQVTDLAQRNLVHR